MEYSSQYGREERKIQALSLAKECYSMKLDLLTNATVVDDAIRFVSSNKSKEMLSVVYRLMSKYNVDKVYIDGANPLFIRSLKLQIGEDADYDKVIARYRSEKLGDNWSQDMKIVPVNFNSEHKAMLGHCKMLLEYDGGRIAINPDKFDKLITASRTAVDNDGVLDKEST